MNVKSIFAVFAIAALAGCSSWFGSSGDRPRYPSDATVYKCEEGKQLVVRYLDGGKSAMVFYPEREFRLDRVPSTSGVRYSNERTILDVNGSSAVLEEGGQALFAGCKSSP